MIEPKSDQSNQGQNGIHHWQNEIKSNPTSSLSYFNLAEALLAKSRLLAALRAYCTTIKISSDSSPISLKSQKRCEELTVYYSQCILVNIKSRAFINQGLKAIQNIWLVISETLGPEHVLVQRFRVLVGFIQHQIIIRAFIEESKSLRFDMRFQEADNLIKNALNYYRSDVNLHAEFSQIAISHKNIPLAIERIENSVSDLGPKTPKRFWENLSNLYQKHGDFERAKSSIRRGCGELSRQAEQSYVLMRQGKTGEGLSVFTEVLHKLFKKKEVIELWLNSYLQVSQFFDSEPGQSLGFKNQGVEPESLAMVMSSGSNKVQLRQKSYVKILPSGMGWSGSSALADYFKEFEAVSTTPNEFPHIRGMPSLRTLRLESKDFKSFRDHLLRFFALTLLGYGEHETYSESRTVASSRLISRSKKQDVYALGVNCFLRNLLGVYDSGCFNCEIYAESSNLLLNSIASTFAKSDDRFCIFDNVIPLSMLTEIEMIDNGFLLCTVRDPRSNYVALIRENTKFIQTLDEFIEGYRKKRLKIENDILSVKNPKSSLMVVQFEEFVMSEEYRYGLANKIGLNADYHSRKHQFFQPWISKKNVFNYRDFPDQKAIQEIEKALPEYLWHG